MKLSAVFVTLAVAQKSRPDEIDCIARFERLFEKGQECKGDELFANFAGANPEKTQERIENKLTYWNTVSTNLCRNAHIAAGMDWEEDDGLDRINFDDSCSCLGGIAGGYRTELDIVLTVKKFKTLV